VQALSSRRKQRSTSTIREESARWWQYALLIGLVVAAYIPVFGAGFIWDDDQHLTANPCIVGPLGFADIWTSAQAVYYPLVLTTFWVVHKIAGLNPLPYHLLNIAFHAGSAVLLWRVLTKLNVRAAWFGAALWALHPVMVESVAWVTELKNTQSCFFYLLSILCFLKARHRDSLGRRDYALSILFFAMAITSKSSTVMLPVVLLLSIWWQDRQLRLRDLKLVSPFIAISFAASAWTIWEQKYHSGALGAEFSQPWLERFAIAGRDLWFYLGKLIWPSDLAFIYPQWKIDIHSLGTFAPLLGVIVAGAVLFWQRDKFLRPVFAAAVYFVVSLFPVLGFFNVYFFRYSFVSDHFQYLAAIGPLALIASAISTGVTNRRAEMSIFAVLLASLGILTWKQATIYRDAKTLYQVTLDRNPECWLAYTNLGGLALQDRQAEAAIDYYKRALTIKPSAPEAQFSLGNIYLQRGQYREAIDCYRSALQENPRHARARNNLAISLIGAGRTTEGVNEFAEAVRLNPTDAESRYNYGYALVQLGQREEGAAHLREALRLNPNYAQAKQQLDALGLTNP
jgi:protein O-mannosyl-transferase